MRRLNSLTRRALQAFHCVPTIPPHRTHLLKLEEATTCAVRLRSESGDMRNLLSSIQDSVLAAGMDIEMRDDDGNPLAVSEVRAAFSEHIFEGLWNGRCNHLNCRRRELRAKQTPSSGWLGNPARGINITP